MLVETLAPTEAFIENLGLSAEADGFPRIAGRLFALMVVEEGPFRFDDLVERLQVSRASISTNTRVLETAGIIERFTMPGERRDFFRLADDPYARMLARSLTRLERIRDIVDHCREHLDPSSPSLSRLDEMGRFYRLAIENTATIISEWRHREPLGSQRAPHPTSTTGHPA